MKPPDPNPLHRADRPFMNDQAQLQRDAPENYAYHGYVSSTFISYSQVHMEAPDRLVPTLNVPVDTQKDPDRALKTNPHLQGVGIY